MGIPNEGFTDWVSNQLIQQLRQRNIPAEMSYEDIFWSPFMDSLWAKVKISYKPLILEYLSREKTKGWGLALCRGLQEDLTIKKTLLSMLPNEQDLGYRYAIFHELSAQHLEQEDKNKLLNFVTENIDEFLRFEKEYLKMEDNVIEFCKKRTVDVRFSHKKWIYSFTALLEDNENEKKDFIDEMVKDSDPFVSKSAQIAFAFL